MADPSPLSLRVLISGLEAISVPPPELHDLRALLDDSPDPVSAPGGDRPLHTLPLQSLGLDSLGRMEFCIQLEIDHGVPLTPDQLVEMSDLGELLAFIEASQPSDPLSSQPAPSS